MATNPNSFPWYDSGWLTSFVRVRNWLTRHYPTRVAEFDEMLCALQTSSDFKTIQGSDFLTPNQLNGARAIVDQLQTEQLIRNESTSFGRELVRHHPFFNELQLDLLPKVEELVGEDLDLSYNFLSLYRDMGVCPLHMDSPEAKWTLDICLNQSRPWPIHFSPVVPWPSNFSEFDLNWEGRVRKQQNFDSVLLHPGHGVIFSGSSQWHYRDPLPRKSQDDFCHLIFFHFVPKGLGIYQYPKIWALHMGLPEMERVANGERFTEAVPPL